jgi:hypothetical protein
MAARMAATAAAEAAKARRIPFDSSGNASDVRVRGNAYQVLEKYLQLARDAGHRR